MFSHSVRSSHSVRLDFGSRRGVGLRRALMVGLAVAWVLSAGRAGTAQDAQNQEAQETAAPGQAVQQPAAQDAAQADPPARVARLGVLLGNVSVEPASVDQFSAAELNYPLTTGDRIYADAGSNAELQTGHLAVLLGQQTDLTVTAMTDTLAQFGLAQGSVHLKSFALDAGETVELDTPNVAVTMLQPGDVRVDVDPDSDTTTVAVASGQAEVDGNGLQQVLNAGQRVRLAGSDPVSAQWLDAAAADGLDNFSGDRDGVYASAVAGQGEFVSPDTIGAQDLKGNGDWETDDTYGAVWFPSSVAVGWVPYSCGRWAWVAPWGWNWVGCESWGFAPFHYGRWMHRGPRWGWVPGPPGLRPVYAPALVVFAGGKDFRVGGVGVTAWFPLGPGEPYVPWYHASPRYENRLNVADLHTRNIADARRIYEDREAAYAAGPETGRRYVNRPLATVAVDRTAFAGGRPVAGSALRLDPQQAAEAQLLPHPLVTPERAIVAAAPARAIPARAARPTLATREETMPRRGPERPVRPAEGAAAASAGTAAGSSTGVARPAPIERNAAIPVQPRTLPEQRPAAQTGGGERPAEERPAEILAAPAAPTTEQPRRAEQAPGNLLPSRSLPPQRPLFNRAIPPPPRPSFEQQQRAIESVDPGRPLGPRQMENLRQNQPAGPPQIREMPHAMPMPPPPRPMPAPRPAPMPRSAPPPAPKH